MVGADAVPAKPIADTAQMFDDPVVQEIAPLSVRCAMDMGLELLDPCKSSTEVPPELSEYDELKLWFIAATMIPPDGHVRLPDEGAVLVPVTGPPLVRSVYGEVAATSFATYHQ
jgi:hypothetical protein